MNIPRFIVSAPFERDGVFYVFTYDRETKKDMSVREFVTRSGACVWAREQMVSLERSYG